MELCLLDSDMLSEVLKQRNEHVRMRLNTYLGEFDRLTFSAVTWFEIIRGLRSVNATSRIHDFEKLCSQSNVIGVSIAILDRAADLWVLGKGRRNPTLDADLLIAASALEVGATLATGNVDHFSWIPRLRIDDWRRAP